MNSSIFDKINEHSMFKDQNLFWVISPFIQFKINVKVR